MRRLACWPFVLCSALSLVLVVSVLPPWAVWHVGSVETTGSSGSL